MFQADDRIGPYRLIKYLGGGTFGVVWLAHERTLIRDREVALKLPIDPDPDLTEIQREAQLWAKLGTHPNVVPVYDAAVYDGQVAIASEYISGGTLMDWLKTNSGQAPSIENALDITLGILAGLEHLHHNRLIHRDLKPGNILMQDDTPRLTDFGLARVLNTLQQTTRVSGTPQYMAPEMFDGHYSEQSDLWATGVILYRLLCGSLPFVQQRQGELMKAILHAAPHPLAASVPESLQRSVMRTLEKEPTARGTTAQMRQDLETVLTSLRHRSVPMTILPAPISPAPPIHMPPHSVPGTPAAQFAVSPDPYSSHGAGTSQIQVPLALPGQPQAVITKGMPARRTGAKSLPRWNKRVQFTALLAAALLLIAVSVAVAFRGWNLRGSGGRPGGSPFGVAMTPPQPETKAILTRALQTSENISDPNLKASVLREIAATQAESGDTEGAHRTFADALAMADKIPNPDLKADACRDIAVAQAKSGDMAGANRTFESAILNARTISDVALQAAALRKLVVAEAQAGHRMLATETAYTLTPSSETASALYDIAVAQAKAGEMADAAQTAESIPDAYKKVSALCEIALAQARDHDPPGANRTFETAKHAAETIKSTYIRASALHDMAVAQARSGDLEGAKQTVNTIRDTDFKLSALSELSAVQAEAQAKAGKISDAKQTVNNMTDLDERDTVLHDIAVTQGKAGDATTAKQIADMILDSFKKASALRESAIGEARSGDLAGANRMLVDAKQAVDRIAGDRRNRALHDLAAAQAEVGDVEDAMRIADTFAPTDKAAALREIAVAQAKSRDTTGAKKTADAITDTGSKALALHDIARLLAKARDVEGAIETAWRISDAYHRASALTDVAKALVEKDSPDASPDDH